jgi:predicted amidohydrolase YtcJ
LTAETSTDVRQLERNVRMRLLITGLLAAAAFAATLFFILQTPMNASLILLNGTFHTLDSQNPSPSACAIRGGTIAAVGSSRDILARYQSENVIDCSGRTVVPGLVDAHAHVNGLGMFLRSLMLAGTSSPAEICSLLRNRVGEYGKGEWIYGRGWDQNLWPIKEFPHADLLDAVSPDNPVVLVRIDGHAAWVNSRAMAIAGITVATPDPPGGRIIRDASGNPTGVFLDNARDIVESHVPPATADEIRENVLGALHECAAAGITEIGDMGADSLLLSVYMALADEGKLPIRLYCAVSAPGPTWSEWSAKKPLIGYAGGMLTIRAMKLYTDGALGSRGAALVDAYSDDPGNRGLTEISDGSLDTNIGMAIRAGYQPCIHAIGDRGNHMALNAYERALKNYPGADVRPRIEHAQVLLPGDIPRFRSIGVIPSMQPVHATSDMPWAEARLGPGRVRGAYAWRSLLETGVVIPAGSDFPNDAMQPLRGYYAAVTRCDPDGNPPGGWYPDQIMSREEALKAYTLWGAEASFEESVKGTISPGKWADLTVLSDDILSVPAKEILGTRVCMTIVNGKIIYRQDDLPSSH